MSQTLRLPAVARIDAPAGAARSRWLWARTLWRSKPATVGVVILLLIVVAALFAPLVAPYDPNAQEFGFMIPPSADHLMGTDDLGRDLFSRIVYGARISLLVGVITVAIAMVVGVVLGLLAGYYGGWADQVIMRYIDLQWAFPNFIIAVYLVAVFGTGLANVIVAITLAFLDDFARIVRGAVLSLRTQDFVVGARAIGAPSRRIMARHILPNAIAPVIVQATVSISAAILAEAGLSFLGLGVRPSTPTWGLILADARSFISRGWWLAVFPGLAITVTVLSINFVGDALRDMFDVREY
ncbi:MAG: ABC transporter permease [Chloroflexi bacterium]|nr:MAG: ABC transporter permease [Chloroflexota bacterium]